MNFINHGQGWCAHLYHRHFVFVVVTFAHNSIMFPHVEAEENASRPNLFEISFISLWTRPLIDEWSKQVAKQLRHLLRLLSIVFTYSSLAVSTVDTTIIQWVGGADCRRLCLFDRLHACNLNVNEWMNEWITSIIIHSPFIFIFHHHHLPFPFPQYSVHRL